MYPGSPIGQTGIDNGNVARFRSFAERYVIERASTFKLGDEKQDAWIVIDDARKIYEQIGKVAEREYGPRLAMPVLPENMPMTATEVKMRYEALKKRIA